VQVTGGATTTAPVAGVVPGGKVTFAVLNEVASLDPATISNAAATGGTRTFQIFDDLAYQLPDGSVGPGIAQSVTSTDGVNWTVKIRPNVVFSDGEPYTADAVAKHFDRIMANPSSQNNSVAQGMASYKAVDASTLNIALKVGNYQFPRTLARSLGFVPAPSTTDFSKPIGAGAFVLKEWVRDDHMTLVRNPRYWNAPLPYLDEVTMKVITDESQRANTFTTGQVDMMMTSDPASAANIRKTGAAESTVILNGGNQILFNNTKAPFNDPRARKAVAEALDNAAFARDVRNGAMPGLENMFDTKSPFYDPSLSGWNFYNPTDAQNLFNQLAQANGGTFTFTLTAFQTSNLRVAAEWMQGQLNNFKNVKVNLDVQASGSVISNIIKKNYDAAQYGLIFLDPDTAIEYELCNSSQNVTGYCNSNLDKTLLATRTTPDVNARIQGWKDAQKTLLADVPFLFFEHSMLGIFAQPFIKNMRSDGDGIMRFDQVYIQK
jgi:peptide/nickel transport system substrate-binding protein